MSRRLQLTQHKPGENLFRLKPLVATMRVLIAGGLFAGPALPTYADLPVPVPGQGWVSSGSAAHQVLGNTLQIDQHTDKAILNWQSFNVGKENTVKFVQPGSSSIALNRINQQDPSRILGKIVANGQVYLYNKNGFVFGKDSVVNTNTLLASTLNISDEVFNRGITQVFDESGAAALAIEPMQPGDALDPKTAKILIEAGAKIHTDKSGRIIIAAPTIENNGSLSTDKQGQIILAASQDKVYLQAADKDSPFAGLVVEVDTGGKVSNAGDILVRQGNVTMAGFAVNQQGRIRATTSVNVNGSIRLLAQEQHTKQGNKLTAAKTDRDTELNDGLGTVAKTKFTKGSVTEIIADAEGGSAIDDQEQPVSYLETTGNTVQVQSGAAIKVTGGKVNITATDNLVNPADGKKGRILLEKDAVLDVSGSKGVKVAMERNVGEISVQSYELRDAPLQRSGVLKGQTIKVDLRNDTKIVDAGGAQARISRSIDERLGNAGTINMSAGGDIVIKDGAKIDISGGSVNYLDGYIKTTKLMNDYGGIVDISEADPNEHYEAIFGVVKETYSKWGVSKVWDLLGPGQFERGYVEGKNAGSLHLNTPRLAWSGGLQAGSSIGQLQRGLVDKPSAGSVSINMADFQSLQNVRFQNTAKQILLGADGEFPGTDAQHPADLVLSTTLLNRSGVGDVSVKTWGDVSLLAGTKLSLQPAGSLTLQAGNIDIDGSVKAAGGALNLKASVNALSPNAGQLNIGSNAKLDVSGSWVNDLQKGFSASPTDVLAIKGGIVTIQAEGDLAVKAGSVISADGGAWLPISADLSAGAGGDITLAAIGTGALPSTLTLDGKLSAYGLEQNGSLTLESGRVMIGKPDSEDVLAQTLLLGVTNGNFDFSQQLAFKRINLIADFADLTVKSDVHLDLQAKNLQLTSAYLDKATGSSLRDFTKLATLPEHLRQPVQVNLEGRSGVTIETGSTITADKGSTISVLSKVGSIFVDGVLRADAGQIKLAIKAIAGLEYDPKQAIWLGEHARLLAQGATRLQQVDLFGHRSGEVLAGGEISITAERGKVVLQQGSMLDVSGTRAKLDIFKSGNNSQDVYASKTIASDAGAIKLSAAEGMIVDGTLQGRAGSANNHGAVLVVNLDRSKRNPPDEPKTPFPNNPLVINITQVSRRSLDEEFQFGADIPDDFIGQVNLSADKINAAGIANLSLSSKDQVRFVGDVEMSSAERISIDAKDISAVGENGGDAGKITVNTVFLEIGSSLNRGIADSAEIGTGEFTGNAQWLQLSGATQWNGFSRINLNSVHDLRTVGLRNADEQRDYLGGLVTAANLNLQASQIYPSTLTDFTFAVKNNSEAQITISGANTDTSPLSAGGILSFSAPIINQQGVIKAPLGSIHFNAEKSLNLAANSLTSVSAAGQVIPFGVTQGGLDWLYPLDSLRNLVFDAPAEKRLVFSAPEISVAKDSVVDVSGGGDLLAYEFQPGAGGSFDYLQSGSAAYQGGFAIIPTLGSQLAPYDHYESNGFTPALGSQVYLSASADLPAGAYTILPAHYALLPGAFLVTPQAESQDIATNRFTVDGLSILPGYQLQAGTGIRDARVTGYLLESSAQVRKRAQYDLWTANQFYEQKAKKNESAVPVLPRDGGQISLIAQTKLVMDGQFMVDALTGGRGARMDIAANRIHVVKQLSETPVADTLEILAADLNKLHVDSLLLGGARSRDKSQDGGTDITVTAQDVLFTTDAYLQGPEIMAVAGNLVEVQAGAGLDANTPANSGDTILNIKGDGALLRVSGDKQVQLNRTETSGAAGELRVAAGSTLKAAKSMLLDASQSTRLLGDIQMQGGSLNLAANTINIGEVDNLGGDALNLSNRKLVDLAVDELVLTGRDSIGLYGNVGRVDANGDFLKDQNGLVQAIQFDSLVINTAGFTGHGSTTDKARLQTGSLLIQNTAAATNQQVVDGHGQLDLVADSTKIGNGNFAIQGFDAVNINAAKEFRAVGKANLDIAANLQLATPALLADGGSNVNLNAGGYHADVSGPGGSVAAGSGYGGVVSVTADSIAFNTKAVLASGSFGLHALNGDVMLGEQANIDLAGRAIKFADQTDFTAGGRFTATTAHGKLAMAAGSVVNVDSGGGQAAGGRLLLQAPEQSIALLGKLQAKGGSALLDVNAFDAAADFDALMQVLADAGVKQEIYFRTHNADIVQHAKSTINAENVTLVTDLGAINLAGTIQADAAEQGGNIQLYAGDAISLAGTSKLSATGTGVNAKGGKILLSSVDADDDSGSGIDIQDGANINVSGNGGMGGAVTLRALSTDNGINIQPIKGTVTGFSKFYAEAVKKYSNVDLGDDGQINSVDINKIKLETDAYMTAATMLNIADTLAAPIRVVAGVEIDYFGDLTLKDSWDFVDWRYAETADAGVFNKVPGRLVIRTDGNLLLEQTLTDGFKNQKLEYLDDKGQVSSVEVVDKLQQGQSWSYHLVAGADLQSADMNKTSAPKDVTVGSNVRVRTGTGDISVNAGGNIVFTAGQQLDNKAAAAAARNSLTLLVADASKWKIGGYLSGTGIAPGTIITAIQNGNVIQKTLAAAASKSLVLPVADINGWKVGDYLSGSSGLAAGTTIVGISDGNLSYKIPAATVKGSFSVQLNSHIPDGWQVGDYLAGTGKNLFTQIASGTQITSINSTGVEKVTTTLVAKNSTSLKVGDSSNWVVGDYLKAGNGIATGTLITAINNSTKTVTLSKPVTIAIVANSKLSTLPSIHFSKATSQVLAANYEIKNLPAVQLSKATTQAINANVNIKTLPSVTLSKPLSAPVSANSTIKATYTPGSIYSAGTPTDTNPYGTLANRAVASSFYSEYPVNGGDLTLSAAGNIKGALSNNDFNDWLLRVGNWPEQPTAWGVALGYIPANPSVFQPGRAVQPLFQQNVGSFGGGKVVVNAGGDINDLEVVMPTTGKQIGDADASVSLKNFNTNQVEVNGGGIMEISAAGNIAGGSFYLGKGSGSLTAAGQITGGSQFSQGPALLIGDTNFKVSAGTGVSLSGVSDPMILHKGDVNFFSYSAAGAINASSLSGDVLLGADGRLFSSSGNSNQETLARIYPASLHASAFGGNIDLLDEIILFPAAEAELSLFAEQNITAEIGIRMGMSDGDRLLLPTPEQPLTKNNMADVVGRIDPFAGDAKLAHASVPVHSGDHQPVRLVTRQGDIENIEFNLAKKALLKSGRDMINLSLSVQHTQAGDITLLDAARDIRYTSARDPGTGALLSNSAKIVVGGPGDVLVKTGRHVELGASDGISTVGNVLNTGLSEQGANLTFMVGVNGGVTQYVDFISQYQPTNAALKTAFNIAVSKDSNSKLFSAIPAQVYTDPDYLKNYVLEHGVDLRHAIEQTKQLVKTELSATVQAQVAGGQDLLSKINKLKAELDDLETVYAQINMLENGNKLIGTFMKALTGNTQLTDAQALAQFKTLSKDEYLQIQPQLDLLVAPVLFKEIKHAGTASAGDKALGNAGGYAAIETLLPGNDRRGDLSMYFSKIHTTDGGDINLLVPGGQVNAGLAVSFTGAKSPSELGIVVQQQGNINALVHDDFLVNTSRVFALDGGDIMIWSSEGDIDAGRGAKSAISAPKPDISFDEKGNMKITFPPVVSGSGIRTAASSDGVNGGDVFLFAPKGVVDAGEAGIGGTNVTISATAVLGANNIQVSGVGTGVPVAATGSMAAGLTGTSNLSAGVSKMAESAVKTDVGKEAGNSLMKAILGMLNIEVLGFGDD